MPYSIRKQKCKQSDGDAGSYTLSYTDKKGKGHSACHTSRKKARGQIAAIEGPYEGAESGDNGEVSLREAIRYLLDEADTGGGGDESAPGEVIGSTENVKPIKNLLFTWKDVYTKLDKKLDDHPNRDERPTYLGDAQTALIDIMNTGPTRSNKNGETAVIAALNVFADDFDAAKTKPGTADYDIDITKSITVNGNTLKPGTYEVKTINTQNALARLGAAKAVNVASVPAMESLVRLGRKYSNIIAKSKFVVDDSSAGQALATLKEFFESKFSRAKGKTRYQNMLGLQLSANAIIEIKSGKFFEGLQACVGELEKAGLSNVVGLERVTLTSSLSNTENEDVYEFDPKTWDLQVQPYLKLKMGEESDKNAVKALREALREMWGVIRDELPLIKELSNQKFWDELATKTQMTGEDSVTAILGVDKNSVYMYTFPDLTVKSIVEQGRMELMPKDESGSTPAAPINSGFTRSHTLSALIRELVRHAK